MTNSIGKAVSAILNYRYIVLIGTALFFCMSGAAVLLVVLNANLMRERLNHEFNERQLVIARQTAEAVGLVMNQIENDINLVAEISLNREKYSEIPYLVSYVLEKDIKHGLSEIGIVEINGGETIFFDGDGGGLLTSHIMEELETDCRSETLIARMNIVEKPESGPSFVSITFARRLSSTEKSKGILCGSINASYLLEKLVGNIHTGISGRAWVVNDNGTYMYNRDASLIGKNAFVSRRRRDPDKSFGQINDIMRRRMLNGQEGAYKYELPEGEEKPTETLLAFAPATGYSLIPGAFWSIAVEAPIAEAEIPARSIFVNHIVAESAIIAGLFLFGLTATAYQHRISQKLKMKVSLQEEYISGILNNSKDAIIFIDISNKIQVWNKGAETTFGYTAEEMLGQTFHKLIPPDVDAEQELLQIKKRIMCDGHLRNYRAVRITKDGRRITIDLSRSAVYSKSGDMIGSIAIIKDVTETTELEQRIYNTEKLASIGILAAGVAHEINNPLAVILGFTDLVKEKLVPGTKEFNDLKTIEDNANYAKRVVENMLGFARVTEGQSDRFSIGEVVKKVVDVVNNSLALRNIELEVAIQNGIPEINGDPREIQQVLFNLVNNSMAAMAEIGGRLKIAACLSEDKVTLTVEDNGSGIPDRIRERIFDPFFTTKKVGEGTGLGLSLCYGIIKKYGGRLSFKSHTVEDYPGGPAGTIFEVSLPVGRSGQGDSNGT